MTKIEVFMRDLPFAIQYSFLGLISARRIHFLDFTLKQYYEGIKYIKSWIKGKSEILIKWMEFAIRSIKIKKNNEKSLKSIIKRSFEDKVQKRESIFKGNNINCNYLGINSRLIDVKKL